MFRHNDDELNMFTLVGQTVFEVKEESLGELLIDVSSEPVSVKAGDVIGFHIVDNPVIPYDQDETRMTNLFFQQLDNAETHGHTITMDSSLELGRTYSLLASIVATCELPLYNAQQ